MFSLLFWRIISPICDLLSSTPQRNSYSSSSISHSTQTPELLFIVSDSCKANTVSQHTASLPFPGFKIKSRQQKQVFPQEGCITSLVSIKHLLSCSGLWHSNDRHPNRKFCLCCLYNILDFKVIHKWTAVLSIKQNYALNSHASWYRVWQGSIWKKKVFYVPSCKLGHGIIYT